MPIIYKPRTRYNATNGIQSTITVADPPSGYGGSATHNGLTALPESFLRACGLHKTQKNQSSRVILTCLWFAQGLHSREITEACCRPGHGPHRSHAETDLLGIMIIQPGHQVVLCAGNRKDAGHPGRKKKCEARSFHLCYYQLEPVGSITSRQAYGAGMPAILVICRW